MEPSTKASTPAGAVRVDVTAFRALDSNLGLIRPLVDRAFQVWDLPGWEARAGEEFHDWRLGVRLGAAASGDWSQRTHNLSAALPGIRRAGFREALDVLRHKGQVVLPPSAGYGLSVRRSVVRTARR